jgi:hypothetical protein
MVDLAFLTSFARSAIHGARVRPFGLDVSDLDVDFDGPRAHVATRVIAACLRCDDAAALELPIPVRTLLLLGVSELSLAEPVEAHLRCDCGETAMIELGMEELARFALDRHCDELIARAGDRSVTLRLPTGRDQLRWAELAGEHDVAREVLADLVVEGELTDDLLVAADAVLSEADPLVDLELETRCPACDNALSRHVDLERIALTRLRNARRVLLEQVHALASAYHWTEATIGALPAWRRAEFAVLAAGGRR